MDIANVDKGEKLKTSYDKMEKQIEKFIKKHPDMHVVEERTILPYEYHSDGFYMCLLEKDV